MPTDLLYLADTYRLADEAVIVAIGRDERGAWIETDRTIFYPQGGGQAADTGRITVDGRVVPITFTGFRDGIVYHYTTDDPAGVEAGAAAALDVDRGRRLANARLHTAGHLIAHVLETLDPLLAPAKGYHFPDGPHVEFASEHERPVVEYLDEANRLLADSIAAALPVTATLVDFNTIQQIRPALAPFTPKDKPSRIVALGAYTALPCGGTHVATLSELGQVKITRAKAKKGNIKMSYEILPLSF